MSRAGAMPDSDVLSLRRLIAAGVAGRDDGPAANAEAGPALSDAWGTVRLGDLAGRSWIETEPEALRGRSVLIRTHRPLNAALALTSLDGVAMRLVLCPPDLAPDHLPGVMARACVDAVVSDAPAEAFAGAAPWLRISDAAQGAGPAPPTSCASEWVMFTSGTAGAPKMAVHTLEGLTGAVRAAGGGAPSGELAASATPVTHDPVVWSTFYDIRRYGGLQMLLRALLGGSAMVISSPEEPLSDLIVRIRSAGVTHLSGTPSHWRRLLMRPEAERPSPRYVRLSGEIADQAVLDRLKSAFPEASIGHAYASTEAGVGFEVTDGREGFPAALVDRTDGPVRMRVVDGDLQLRSARAAMRYLGEPDAALALPDGFVDTGDQVERRGDRYHFAGRRSGVVNIGGLKVHPEEVEAVINALASVRLSRVRGRRNPITGALLTADVVPSDPGADPEAARAAILAQCRAHLAPFKVPAWVRLVDVLPISAGGKLERSDA